MGLNVGKIIDGLKLSYGQLRNLLITSIGAIATVWIVGNQVGSMTTKMDAFGATLQEIKTEMVHTRTVTENGLNRIYTDFMEINETNNDLWNSKFQLFIDYGEGNKELLKKLLDYEDKRAAAELERIEKDKEYDIVAEPIDEKKNRSGTVSFTPVDEDGNPIGDEIIQTYDKDGNVIKSDTIKAKDLSIQVKKKKMNELDDYEY